MSSSATPTSSGLEQDARRIHSDGKPLSPGNVAIGVVIGRTSEFFDFFVYGLGSILVFPKLIFPFAPDPVTATLMSFAVFRWHSLRDLWVRSSSCGLIAITGEEQNSRLLWLFWAAQQLLSPFTGVRDDRILGCVLLALFRLGQGFALGGAWDGLASLLSLSAPVGKRGWYAMIPQLGRPSASHWQAFFCLFRT